MSERFRAVDPRGRVVICTDEVWNDHICSGHPEMAGSEDLVRAAIAEPQLELIYRDVDEDDRDVYYRRPPDKRYYIKVIVRFDRTRRGLVITAYRTSSAKSGERIIWPE